MKKESYFWWAFAFCGIVSLIPIWVVKYLPMTDLPQHAAQLSILVHFNDPQFGYSSVFRVDWFTPYLLWMALAIPLGKIFGVHLAIKIFLSILLLGWPLAIQHLLTKVRLSPWGALLGFPLFYGFSFFWGFIPTLMAIPWGVWVVSWAFDFLENETMKSGLILSILLGALFYVHGYIFGVMGLVILGLAVVKGGGRSVVWKRLWPLIPCLPLSVVYFIHSYNIHPSYVSLQYVLPIFDRFNLIPLLIFDGIISNIKSIYAYGVLLVIILLFRSSLSRRWMDWTPFVIISAVGLLAPDAGAQAVFLWYRLIVLMIIFGILVFRPSSTIRFQGLIKFGLFLVPFFWSLVLSKNFLQFKPETQNLEKIISQMDPHKKVLSIVVDKKHPLVPQYPFLHMAQWYQVEKGGLVENSFAHTFHNIVRFRSENENSGRAKILPWHPDQFNWEQDGNYDYFLLGAKDDMSSYVFKDDRSKVRLVAQAGRWWLYEPIVRSPTIDPDLGVDRRS